MDGRDNGPAMTRLGCARLRLDRTFSREQNEIIVEKAIRYASRGIVGVDIAGPRPNGGRYRYADLAPLVETAREAGLGVTIHVGEEGEEHGIAEIGEVAETLRPDRIGHGILAARDEETMRVLREDCGWRKRFAEYLERRAEDLEEAHARPLH